MTCTNNSSQLSCLLRSKNAPLITLVYIFERKTLTVLFSSEMQMTAEQIRRMKDIIFRAIQEGRTMSFEDCQEFECDALLSYYNQLFVRRLKDPKFKIGDKALDNLFHQVIVTFPRIYVLIIQMIMITLTSTSCHLAIVG